MKFKKLMIALFVITAILSLTACTGRKDISNSTFPGIDNADIPDVLEITAGTLGNTYYSSDIKDNPACKSILTVTFEDTTEDDYDTLMTHYQTASIGTDENNALLFEWGTLQVLPNHDSITITALMK